MRTRTLGRDFKISFDPKNSGGGAVRTSVYVSRAPRSLVLRERKNVPTGSYTPLPWGESENWNLSSTYEVTREKGLQKAGWAWAGSGHRKWIASEHSSWHMPPHKWVDVQWLQGTCQPEKFSAVKTSSQHDEFVYPNPRNCSRISESGGSGSYREPSEGHECQHCKERWQNQVLKASSSGKKLNSRVLIWHDFFWRIFFWNDTVRSVLKIFCQNIFFAKWEPPNCIYVKTFDQNSFFREMVAMRKFQFSFSPHGTPLPAGRGGGAGGWTGCYDSNTSEKLI